MIHHCKWVWTGHKQLFWKKIWRKISKLSNYMTSSHFWFWKLLADIFWGKIPDCVYQSCLDVTALQHTGQQCCGCEFVRRKWIYLNTATESMDYLVIPSCDRNMSTSMCNMFMWTVMFTEFLHMRVTRNLVLPQFEFYYVSVHERVHGLQ